MGSGKREEEKEREREREERERRERGKDIEWERENESTTVPSHKSFLAKRRRIGRKGERGQDWALPCPISSPEVTEKERERESGAQKMQYQILQAI